MRPQEVGLTTTGLEQKLRFLTPGPEQLVPMNRLSLNEGRGGENRTPPPPKDPAEEAALPCSPLRLPQKSLSHTRTFFFFNSCFRNHKAPFPRCVHLTCSAKDFVQADLFCTLPLPSPLSVPLWLWLLSSDPWWHHDSLPLLSPTPRVLGQGARRLLKDIPA